MGSGRSIRLCGQHVTTLVKEVSFPDDQIPTRTLAPGERCPPSPPLITTPLFTAFICRWTSILGARVCYRHRTYFAIKQTTTAQIFIANMAPTTSSGEYPVSLIIRVFIFECNFDFRVFESRTLYILHFMIS